jgi:mannose-6-phosphate isomerase-like protein (cupin superfamily)
MRPPSCLPAVIAAVSFAAACGRDGRVADPPKTEAPAPPSEASARATKAGDAASTSRGPAPPPAPIDATLPAPDSISLSNKASCPAKLCRLEGSLLAALLGPPESLSPAGIWEEDIGPGAAVSFAKRPDMDVLGVALGGTVTLVADETKSGGVELTAWHAFVAPGAGFQLRAKGGAARIVLVVVTPGAALAAKVANNKASAWTTRPAPIASIDLAGATDLTWGKGAYHARIGFEAETSPHASLGLLKMSADGAVAPHEHENEWEHMAVLEGEGDFIQGVGENEQTLHATPGMTFSVPPATRHQWKPAGTRPFLGIQVYTPPGPEQRFRKLAAPR